MKKLGLLLTMVGAALLLTTNVMAQETGAGTQEVTFGVDEVALISGEDVALELTTATPGAAIAVEAVVGYVNVSSTVATGLSRTITASIASLPAGSTLTIATAIPATGAQGGDIGEGSDATAITNAGGAITLVTSIGSCYTGTTYGTDGYQLTYAWTPESGANYANLVVASTAVDITLTLTADE